MKAIHAMSAAATGALTASALAMAARAHRQRLRQRIRLSDAYGTTPRRSIRKMQRGIAYLTGLDVSHASARAARNVFAALGFIWLERCKMTELTRAHLRVMLIDLLTREHISDELSPLETLLLDTLPVNDEIDSFILRTLASLRDMPPTEYWAVSSVLKRAVGFS